MTRWIDWNHNSNSRDLSSFIYANCDALRISKNISPYFSKKMINFVSLKIFMQTDGLIISKNFHLFLWHISQIWRWKKWFRFIKNFITNGNTYWTLFTKKWKRILHNFHTFSFYHEKYLQFVSHADWINK